MRLTLEYDNIAGHGLIVRLPLGFGISFWGFHWWSWMIGCSLGDDGFLEWHLGPFAGEIWREDLAMLKMTPSEYELKMYRESKLYLARHEAERAVLQKARHFYGHYGPLNDALDRLDALDKPEVQKWECPNPNCINGAEDTGGVTPWDEPILIPCPACQDRTRNAAAYIEWMKASEGG